MAGDKHKESYNPGGLGSILEQDEDIEKPRNMSYQKTDFLAEI